MPKNTPFNPFSVIGYPMCNEKRNECTECNRTVQLHTLTYTDQYGTYSVSCNRDCSSFPVLLETLFVPVMLASGYHRGTIEEYMVEV